MSLTALIIDDEPLARQELQYLLERAGGVEVLAQGTNGIEAVELIREHNIYQWAGNLITELCEIRLNAEDGEGKFRVHASAV